MTMTISEETQSTLFKKAQNMLDDLAKFYMEAEGIKFDIKVSHDQMNKLKGKERIFVDNNPYFIQLLNHKKKLIKTKPRTVNYSCKFKVSKHNQEGFRQLEDTIKTGGDLNKYLSKLIDNGAISDGMLDGFGCKHFHLGTHIDQSSNKIQRTKDVAIALVNESEVFFVLVKPHGKGHGLIWGEKDIIEIIHAERPDLIQHAKSRFINIHSHNQAAAEIIERRRARVNESIVIDEKTAYLPINGGNTLGGLSMDLTIHYLDHSKSIFKILCNLYMIWNEYVLDPSCMFENSNLQYDSDGLVTLHLDFQTIKGNRVELEDKLGFKL